MADFYAPQNPGLAAFIQPYLSWRERQANESRLADLMLPKSIPDYLAGLAYGTNPREPPLTSWRSTLAYGLPAVEALGIAPAAIPAARGGLAAYGALERRMIPPAGASAGFLNQRDPAVRAMITDQLKQQGLRDVQITDGVIRDEIARRNAVTMLGLPAENTAADRAAAMGFDTPAYHGSRSDFDGFSIGYGGSASNAPDAKLAIFSSNKPEVASGYSTYGGNDVMDPITKDTAINLPKVYPLKLRGGDMGTSNLGGAGYNPNVYSDLINTALREGRSGVKLMNTHDNPTAVDYLRPDTIYANFNPADIRSRFAAFDPAREKTSDILAGIAGLSLIPALTLQDYFRQGQ